MPDLDERAAEAHLLKDRCLVSYRHPDIGSASVVRERTLVFPAGLPDAQRYREAARSAGRTLVGASSLAFDPEAGAYDDWAVLPYVHDPGFAQAIGDLIHNRAITAIYSPHGVVSGVLKNILPRIAPGVRLIDPDPAGNIEATYRHLLVQAEAAARTMSLGDDPTLSAPALSVIERAGIVRLVDAIPGMTSHDKIDAIMAVMPTVPSGDVVEIGSWWGRSAALLLLLARRFGVGPVLCVDPWRSDCLDQGVTALDRASARLRTDEAFAIFQINLSPLAHGDLNYLRATATEAAAAYRAGLTVASDFGATTYTGRIALLHIDGNHAYAQVEADLRLWAKHVVQGGWIVIDDYVWAFGDGPKIVGDAFLAGNAERISRSFVMGTALFIRLAAP